jgi:hypothetical protein
VLSSDRHCNPPYSHYKENGASLNYISTFNAYGTVNTALGYYPLNAVNKPVAVCSENHTKHVNVICWPKITSLNVKLGGT